MQFGLGCWLNKQMNEFIYSTWQYIPVCVYCIFSCLVFELFSCSFSRLLTHNSWIHHFLTTINTISKLNTNLCKLQTSRSKSNSLVKNIFSFVRLKLLPQMIHKPVKGYENIILGNKNPFASQYLLQYTP